MVLFLFALMFLVACLLAYWRTFWVGRKYRVPVAVCCLLTEWWSLKLTQQQKDSLEKPKEP